MSNIIPIESSSPVAIPTDDDINATIDRLENAVLNAANSCKGAVFVAMELGQQLLAKKDSLEHGEWLPWVARFPRLSKRSVQDYTRIAANAQRAALLMEQDPSASMRKLLAFLSEDSEPGPANLLAPTSKVATVFQRVLKFADDDKLGASEEAELLNYWEQLSQKLKQRGLLTDDLKPAQQLAA